MSDIFSKRQRILRGEMPDIYTYDKLPIGLRNQIIYTIKDSILYNKEWSISEPLFEFINKKLCREYGLTSLGYGGGFYEDKVYNFFLKVEDVEKALDVVELCFKFIDTFVREKYEEYVEDCNFNLMPDEAINQLNSRFKEHGVGYQFSSGTIIRIDSQLIHNEITRPALGLLLDEKFSGANEEYLKALEHYRHGRNKECLVECSKAFESTMKIICTEKSWKFNSNDNASKLIKICLTNELIPSFMQTQYTSLESLLSSGISTIRNRTAGHGQGVTPQIVTDELARYGMNLTGSSIIFLIESSKLV